MIVTTTPTIEGHTIKEYKGLVSGEVIFGMNFLKDFGASLRDFFGGRTDSYEKAMLEGRETAQVYAVICRYPSNVLATRARSAEPCTKEEGRIRVML